MRQLRLFIPGHFEDAYLYMGWLMMLTESRTLRVVRVEDIVQFLLAAVPGSSHVVKMMLSQNQWIGDSQFRSWLTDKSAVRALLSEFGSLPSPQVELNIEQFQVFERELGINATVCLDLLLYNKRLFVCTDTGLYGGDLDFDGDFPVIRTELQRRLESRCISANAAYGAVSVSCGDDGLWGSVMEFESRNNQRMKKVEDRSIKTRWLAYDLVNYPVFTEPHLLRNRHRVGDGVEGERSVITELGAEHIDMSFLLDRLRAEYNVEKEAIQYVFNSSTVMFVHTVQGNFYSLGFRRTTEGQPRTQFTRTYKGTNTRILSAALSRVGVIVETDARVLLFHGGEWHSLLEEPVVAVRTFPQSRRYQNLVAIAAEDGLHLVGLLDENEFVAPPA